MCGDDVELGLVGLDLRRDRHAFFEHVVGEVEHRDAVIGQRERIALPISPRLCTRVAANTTCRPSASASASSGSSPRSGRNTSCSEIKSAPSSEITKPRARVRPASPVQPRPAVHVVRCDQYLAASRIDGAGRRGARNSARCGDSVRGIASRARRRRRRPEAPRRVAPSARRTPCCKARSRPRITKDSEGTGRYARGDVGGLPHDDIDARHSRRGT